MAGVPTGGFPVGINNTAAEEAMPRNDSGGQIALRDAVNVDIAPDGKPKRRAGYTAIMATTLGHSAWSDDYLPWGLFVDGSNLCVMHQDESIDVLRSDLALGLPVSYTRINDAVWWTNGVQNGQITLDLEQLEWAVGHPSGPPAVAATSGGMLPQGTYQVTATLMDSRGRESGAPLAAMVEVASDGAIALTAIPQPPPGGRTRIYMTEGQDGVLRAAVTVPDGTTEYTLLQLPKGRTCDTQFLRPMPAGHLITHGIGRMYVAVGREVFFSPALGYGLFNPASARIGFNGRVQMIAYVGDGTEGAGLYVSDNKRVYWLGAPDPANWTQRIAYSSPALPGPIAWVPGYVVGATSDALVPCWHARNGRLCVGLPGGQVLTPQPRDGLPDAVWDGGDSAALTYIENAGDRRLVSTVRGASSSALAASDEVFVEEHRHYSNPN